MSTTEHDPQIEQRSKIKLTRNAKGDPQWEISVVADEQDATLDAMRAQAVAQWRALEMELVRGFGGATA